MTDEVTEAKVGEINASRTEDGELARVNVKSYYSVIADGELKDVERAELLYDVRDGVAYLDGIEPFEVREDGKRVRVVGLHPNALRTVPAAEEAVENVPGVEAVERAEDVFESVLEAVR